MIRFLEPWWLLTLLPVLAMAGAYVWRQFRKRQYAIRFTNVDLLRKLAPKGLGGAGTSSAAAFLLMLGALAAATARPSVDAKQPLERATVMLAIDVSLSMQAEDVAPSRIEAAQEAAKAFVERAAAELQPGPGVVRESGERTGRPDQGPVRGGRRDRRADAGRGHRDRRGGLHVA